MSQARRLVVRGRVQGVGFRWFVRETARRCGLSGWVRNQPDGSVELQVAGPAAMIELLATAAGTGPPGAEVTSVEQGDVQVDAPLAHPFAILK